MKEFNVYSMDCLNKKAINTISSIHHLFSGLKSGQSKIVPMARVGKNELTFKDFETLFGTYAKYRSDNELKEVGYHFTESSVKTSTFEIGSENVNLETITIFVGSEISSDVFNVVDVPSEYRKRNGKAEKAKTAENTAKKAEDKKTVEKAQKIVSEAEELKNEEKSLKKSADEFNAEVEKDLKEIEEIEALKKSVEVFTNRIALIFGNDVTKAQKKAIADALRDFAQSI